MIPLRDKFTDISSLVAQGYRVKEFVVENAKEIAKHVEEDDLNERVADLAREYKMNSLMIQRLVEEVNTKAFEYKYKIMSNSGDRRVIFDLCTQEKVLAIMGDEAPPIIINPNLVEDEDEGEDQFSKIANITPQMLQNSVDPDIISDMKLRRDSIAKRANVVYKNLISKVGSVIVKSDLIYNNGNTILNSLVSESLNKKATEDIIKSSKASANLLKSAGRVSPDYDIDVSISTMEKKAHNVFGKHSLLENEGGSLIYDLPKVAAVDDVEDYNDLLKIAKEAQNVHEKFIKPNMEVF